MQKPIDAYNSVLELVGNTPLVKLNRIVSHIPGAHYAKVEAFNPGHSAKDRIAIFIIEEAERKGFYQQLQKDLQKWYARDKTRTIQLELAEGLASAKKT